MFLFWFVIDFIYEFVLKMFVNFGYFGDFVPDSVVAIFAVLTSFRLCRAETHLLRPPVQSASETYRFIQ